MQLSKSKIFLIFCVAFIVGVFFGPVINYETVAVLAMVFIIIATLNWGKRPALVIGLAGLIMLTGAVRFKLDYSQNDLAQFYGQKISATGVVVEEPDLRPDKTYLTVGHLIINNVAIHSKILMTVQRFPQYQYGQKLNFEAKIIEAKEFPDFSYKDYLSRFGIDAVAYYPMITLVSGNFGNPVKLGILQLKQKFVENINQTLSEPQASFLGGLLLGAKHSIPQELINAFNATSTSHIIAVSGYNITIIAESINWLLQWLGLRKRFSFFLSLLGIGIFVVMTGASASVLRAGIMGALLLVALNIGRVYAVTNALTFTAVVMLVVNPQILNFDVGFQLSFAALLGLVYFMPLIEPYFLWVPKFIRVYLLATISAQAFTLPILLSNFGLLSLIAIPVNMAVLIAVPITMLFGFLTGFIGFIWIKLALPVAVIAWVLLTYIIKVVEFAASLPFAAVQVKFNIFWVIGYYLILFIIFLLFNYPQLRWRLKPKNS
jgi:competence protein ComEC